MTTISAKTILRSRNAARPDKVLSTLLLRYPRWVHAEFMTHRVFSRNAASSRAIPVKKLIQDVIDNPAVPLFWGANKPGMQAGEECINEAHVSDIWRCGPAEIVEYTSGREDAWLAAMHNAVEAAQAFDRAGYHKQICNRLLEPFSHITVLVSATEWDNFLELRDHPDAEPHIAMLAREIRKCLEDESTIQTIEPGEWHLPFVSDDDLSAGTPWRELTQENLIKLSVARCASTSYKTVDGFDMTLDRAIALHDKLVSSEPIHASPAEHVAQADHPRSVGISNWTNGWWHQEEHGNFQGFRQYRHMI